MKVNRLRLTFCVFESSLVTGVIASTLRRKRRGKSAPSFAFGAKASAAADAATAATGTEVKPAFAFGKPAAAATGGTQRSPERLSMGRGGTPRPASTHMAAAGLVEVDGFQPPAAGMGLREQ